VVPVSAGNLLKPAYSPALSRRGFSALWKRAVNDLRNSKHRLKVNMISGFPKGNPALVKHEWVKRPSDPTGRDTCLFVTYSRNGSVPDHAVIHARAWAARGYMTVIVVVLDDLSLFNYKQNLDFSSGVLIRENLGYDFGAWAAGIRLIKNLNKARTLALVNDSVYGPMDGFDLLLARARASKSDVIGATESEEFCSHIQSYLVFFKRAALQSRVFWKFWKGVRLGNREQAIWNYELRLKRVMESGGLKVEALFPNGPDMSGNPTLTRWKELADEGFPFVKAQLLRDNPRDVDITDWRAFVEERSFNPAVIDAHLGVSADRRVPPLEMAPQRQDETRSGSANEPHQEQVARA
jgi:hypothetical protein